MLMWRNDITSLNTIARKQPDNSLSTDYHRGIIWTNVSIDTYILEINSVSVKFESKYNNYFFKEMSFDM